MSMFGIGALVVSVGATAYGAIEQKKAANNAASVDEATAGYNAKYNDSMAEQLDLDTQQNIRTQRQENQVYLSREESSYASAGVLATSGSALDARITNAGRMEQKIQQQWVNSQQQQQAYYSKGDVGILEGDAQAGADRMQGNIALINGGSKIASSIGDASEKGVFDHLFKGDS